MTKRILVDAVHPEEVRVAVADDSKLIDYEFESEHRKQIKSNIYLGKITRVEPSLQAAFVEYGGNRQGFLPFSEIHYDYYQIPVEDKKKLAQMIEEESNREERLLDEQDGITEKSPEPEKELNLESSEEEIKAALNKLQGVSADDIRRAEELAKQFIIEYMGEDYYFENYVKKEEINTEDEIEETIENSSTSVDFYKKYKIQEVIKRNQVVLIQVVKEERGNKGASLTTYTALAGRYCVFMPNTEKGGGVSRRISNYSERKRIRQIVKNLEVPKGSSVIIRTAGMEKEEEDIKNDFNYLTSLWNNIRKQTLESTAPALIYEESDIVRRTLRDLFKGDVEEIIVEGDEAYKNAANFMDVISPNQKNSLIRYKSHIPIFQKYKMEERLDELYEPQVKLESGGSIVITPTEALVAIDVNSGKSTKERSVEDTALSTNLEAAREIARHLRLRDLAGLIVIDFIDMRDVKNRKAIERELKDALRNDRAKIQIGRISIFGLLEMSRQRLHASISESSSSTCPMCKGIGVVRSPQSLELKVLRAIEGLSGKRTIKEVNVKASRQIKQNLLENKKAALDKIEELDKVIINIEEDPDMLPNHFEVTSTKSQKGEQKGKASGANKNSANRNKSGKGKYSKTNYDNTSPDPKNHEDAGNSINKEESGDKLKEVANNNSESDYMSQDSEGFEKNNNSDEESQQNKSSQGGQNKSSKLAGLWKKITS